MEHDAADRAPAPRRRRRPGRADSTRDDVAGALVAGTEGMPAARAAGGGGLTPGVRPTPGRDQPVAALELASPGVGIDAPGEERRRYPGSGERGA